MKPSANADAYDVVFVTAGEMPSASNLHASQILEPATALAREGVNVTWLAVVPLLSQLRDLVTGGSRLRKARETCERAGVTFVYGLAPLSIAGTLSFVFRNAILRRASRRLAERLQHRATRPTIFHARSYYAAQLACALRAAVGNLDWKVSFDMRSLLPEEFPLTQGLLGTACFGFAKRWEHRLLRESDVAFLPLDFARERMHRESGVEVIHAPIQGFDRPMGWSADFATRWENRRIGYAGSIASWHSPELLRDMLASVPGGRPVLAGLPDRRLSGLSTHEYRIDEMPAYYDGLLALVVPGRTDLDDYFVSFKLRCNFFSTKAAESLSLGVPLVVSSNLLELAEFVRSNGCGAIYDPARRAITWPEGDWTASRDAWQALTEAAVRVGVRFQRRSVLSVYRARWDLLFNREAGPC